MKDWTLSSETLRFLAAPIAAFAAAAFAWFLLILLSIPFDRYDSESMVIFHGPGLVAKFGAGFAFVFVGSLVAGRGWVVMIPLCFVALGTGCFVYLDTKINVSNDFPVWDLVAAIIGGLCAAGAGVIKQRERTA